MLCAMNESHDLRNHRLAFVYPLAQAARIVEDIFEAVFCKQRITNSGAVARLAINNGGFILADFVQVIGQCAYKYIFRFGYMACVIF